MHAVLGRGAMGTVFRAVQLEMDREVALKLISPGGRDEAAMRGRFAREVRSLARIEHPNIVPVYDAGDWQGFPYYTMKLVPRGPLSRHLERFSGDVRSAVLLMAKMARAVGALHAAGVMHRDLKPLNILLGDNDEPMVADFGLARCIDDDSGPTESGSPVGTRPYMSPEQSLGSKTDYTPACDIWAVGIILFEVLTGRRPFEADDPVELYLKIRGEPAPPASSFNPTVPLELDAVIGRCLAKRPEDRYPTADAVADHLERWLAGEAFDVPAPLPRPTPVRPRRRRWVAAAVVLAAVCGVLLGVVFWQKDGNPPKRTIAERLAAGETVELIGATGLPLVEWRPISDHDDLLSTVRDGCCTLTSMSTGAVELISEPLPVGVRLETEVAVVRNGTTMSWGGVYAGRKEFPGPNGPHQTVLRFQHSDEQKADEQEAHETPRAVAVWRGGGTYGTDLTVRAQQPSTYRPAANVPPLRWHRWVIEIHPGVMTAAWDSHPFKPIPAPDFDKAIRTSLGRTPFKELSVPPPPFGLGLGLCVHKADAVFRNTKLVPLVP
jgi:serine/threonine-protein kinase